MWTSLVGGPAGSSCARTLVRGGARVAVIDRADVSAREAVRRLAVGPDLGRARDARPRTIRAACGSGTSCHVRYQGVDHAIACRGWFIRRFELDDFLLRTSGAELHLGTPAGDIARDSDGLWSVAGLRGRHLVGAGGTHCPVARLLQPPRPMGPVGVQEHEFQADAAAVARTRIGGDGEPELLLHDDLSGYSWNVPKTDWLERRLGTADPNEVRAAWQAARAPLLRRGPPPGRGHRGARAQGDEGLRLLPATTPPTSPPPRASTPMARAAPTCAATAWGWPSR